jgi:DNA-directed RNA polymerase subunit RPC12/RpoP
VPKSITISTLGDLADHGMGLAWHCEDCGRELDLTLAKAIELWGRDQTYVRWDPPVKCAGCGSRNISGRVRANTAIRQATGTPFVP